MKTLIVIAFLSLVSVTVSHAQRNTGYLKSSPTHANTDTLTNGATLTQTISVPGYNAVVAIQPIVTKLSGTTAGVARLFGSIDGVNFARINPNDSLVLENIASQSKIFTVAPSSCTHYRLVITGSGTQSTTVLTPAVWRK